MITTTKNIHFYLCLFTNKDLNDTNSFQLMDCLFMPLKFVQIMLHHLYELCRRSTNPSSAVDSLRTLVDELYALTARVFTEIESQFGVDMTSDRQDQEDLDNDDDRCYQNREYSQEEEDDDDLTNVSVEHASQISFEDTIAFDDDRHIVHSSSNYNNNSIELIPVQIKCGQLGGQWMEASLVMRRAQGDVRVKCVRERFEIGLNELRSMRPASNGSSSI